MDDAVNLADWLSAIGTVSAVVWGVWQVGSDRRRQERERTAAVHEIAHAAERVCIAWEKIARLGKARPRQSAAVLMQRHLYTLQECEETLRLLVQRNDLTDGTVRCAVAARQLASRLFEALSVHSTQGLDQPEIWKRAARPLQERAQRTLKSARRLRRINGIRPPRAPFAYQLLTVPRSA